MGRNCLQPNNQHRIEGNSEQFKSNNWLTLPLTDRSVCQSSHVYKRAAQGAQPGAVMAQQGGVADGWGDSGGRDVWTHAETCCAAERKPHRGAVMLQLTFLNLKKEYVALFTLTHLTYHKDKRTYSNVWKALLKRWVICGSDSKSCLPAMQENFRA